MCRHHYLQHVAGPLQKITTITVTQTILDWLTVPQLLAPSNPVCLQCPLATSKLSILASSFNEQHPPSLFFRNRCDLQRGQSISVSGSLHSSNTIFLQPGLMECSYCPPFLVHDIFRIFLSLQFKQSKIQLTLYK